MNNKAFETIRDFCESHSLSKLHQRVLLHKYYEDFYVLIENYRKNEKSEPSEDTIKGFISTLLSEMTLKSNFRLADDEIKNYTKTEIEKVKKNQSIKDFCFSVLSSVIGSIVFSGLLILLFSLAHNQIKSWVEELYKDEKQIEQKIQKPSLNNDKVKNLIEQQSKDQSTN